MTLYSALQPILPTPHCLLSLPHLLSALVSWSLVAHLLAAVPLSLAEEAQTLASSTAHSPAPGSSAHPLSSNHPTLPLVLHMRGVRGISSLSLDLLSAAVVIWTGTTSLPVQGTLLLLRAGSKGLACWTTRWAASRQSSIQKAFRLDRAVVLRAAQGCGATRRSPARSLVHPRHPSFATA